MSQPASSSIPSSSIPRSSRADVAVHATTVLALAWAEARRLLLHPVLLVATAWIAVAVGWEYRHGPPDISWSVEGHTDFASSWTPLYAAAFLVANLAALRDRESTTAETFRAVPTARTERTLALLLAGLIPVGVAAIVATYAWVVIARAGGIPVGSSSGYAEIVPSVVELCSSSSDHGRRFRCRRRDRENHPLPRPRRAARKLRQHHIRRPRYWVWMWFPAYFLMPFAIAARATEPLSYVPAEALSCGRNRRLTHRTSSTRGGTSSRSKPPASAGTPPT